jgi:ABC-type glycerol-3-phosphate transport system permease component
MGNMLAPTRFSIVVGRALKAVLLVVMVGWLVVELYPIFFLVNTALRTDPEILADPFALPGRLYLDNFVAVWTGAGLGAAASFRPIYRNMLNSIVVTAGTLIVLLSVSALAGYALARGRFRGSNVVQQVYFSSLAVPVHVLIIPVFFMMTRFGLRNTLPGLVLMYATMGVPFTVVMMRAYFLSFPRELEEAALIDGCSRLGAFCRVVIPVSRNAIASMAIVNVSWIWSELLFALVLMDKTDVQTLPLAVMNYAPKSMSTQSSIGPQFAAMVFMAAPLMLFYFLFQRQITKGMTMGAFR